MKYTIKLLKEIFFDGKQDYDIAIEIGEIKKTFFNVEKINNIDSSLKGVYVIFDSLGNDNSTWETPNQINKEKRHCLYVGEGKLKARLRHRLTTITEKHGKHLIYFEVADTFDRKLIERLLIKHFKPLYNKENQWEFSDKKQYWDNYNEIISEIEENFNILKNNQSNEVQEYNNSTTYTIYLIDVEGYTINEVLERLESIVNMD